MASLSQDLRYTIRSFRKSPVWVITALVSLSIGIGANALVFSWLDVVLLHPMRAVPENERIVAVKNRTPNGELIDSSYPDYRDLRDRMKSLSGLAAYKNRPVYLGEGAAKERVWAQFVSPDYFDVLGVKPRLGRLAEGGERRETAGAAPVVWMSERLWQSRFQGDASVVGRVIHLNEQPLTVVGVLPAEFRGSTIGLTFELWIPMSMYPPLAPDNGVLERRGSRPFAMIGRLAQGRSTGEANAEAATVAQALSDAFPGSNRSVSVRTMAVVDAPDQASSALAGPLKFLLAIGVLLLVVVCVNVGNLLLARSVAREREFAIRLGLGATRGSLVRLLLIESGVLAVAGAMGGAAFAFLSGGTISHLLPVTDMPAGLDPQLGWPTVVLVAALCLLAALLCGLAPAFHLLRSSVQTGLQSASRGSTAGRGALRMRSLLVSSEIALATVTLAAAGLFLHSFWNARGARPGFEPEGVLLFGLDTNSTKSTSEENLKRFVRLQAAVTQMPGVDGVALAEFVPMGFDKGSWEETSIDGYLPRPGENMKLYHNMVTPGYFEMMKIPLVAGREFRADDDRDHALTAIVNEAFVKRYFPDGIGVGKQLKIWGGQRILNIVGVARDSRIHRLDEAPTPYFYEPVAQRNLGGVGMGLHVRAKGRPELVDAAVLGVIRQQAPELGVTARTTLIEFIGAAYFTQKISAGILGFLGGVSLLLAGIGLYGVMAYAFAQRQREFGVRIAVGAAPRNLIGLAMGEGLRVAIVAVSVGLVLSVGLGRGAASMLYGVGAVDVPVLGGAAVFLLLVAALATWLPARRAAAVDPMEALRLE